MGAKAHCPVVLMIQPQQFPLLCEVLLTCQPTELIIFFALLAFYFHQLNTFSS